MECTAQVKPIRRVKRFLAVFGGIENPVFILEGWQKLAGD